MENKKIEDQLDYLSRATKVLFDYLKKDSHENLETIISTNKKKEEKVNGAMGQIWNSCLNESLWKRPDVNGDDRSHFAYCSSFTKGGLTKTKGKQKVYTKVDRGFWAEFGVYTGRSIYALSQLRLEGKKVYGFDCFTGLPEDWNDECEKGAFDLGGKAPEFINFVTEFGETVRDWPDNIELYTGLFEKTIPKFLKKNEEKASFIHIDCDLYSSTKTVLTLLKDRIQSGTIICFDEFPPLSNPSNKRGELKAFAEFLLSTNLQYGPLSFQTSEDSFSKAGFMIL